MSKTIVLTGSISCGKTTVGKMFEGLGCTFIDADKIVDRLYGQRKVQKLLAKNFGPQAINSRKVNRSFLAQKVFGDTSSRTKLNSLIHPLVFAELKKTILRYHKTKKILVIEVPLFFETGKKINAEFVVAVKCTKKAQLFCMSKKGFSHKQALARIRSQFSFAKKASKADFVLDNSKGKAFLQAQVKKFFESISV